MAMAYFCCYYDYLERCAGLTDAQMGRLIRALLHYGREGETPRLRGAVQTAFNFIASDMDRNSAVYRAKCEQNRENAQKRWAGQPTHANGCKEKDKEKDENEEKEKNNSPLPRAREAEEVLSPVPEPPPKARAAGNAPLFSPPTPEQVRSYCLRRKNGLDPQRFVDYYDAVGWMVGIHPMKDWKAAVRRWESNGPGPNAAGSYRGTGSGGWRQRDGTAQPDPEQAARDQKTLEHMRRLYRHLTEEPAPQAGSKEATPYAGQA